MSDTVSSICFSYGDISAAAMFSDIDKLCIGGFVMFIYMQVVLSKFSWVELRVTSLNGLYVNKHSYNDKILNSRSLWVPWVC